MHLTLKAPAASAIEENVKRLTDLGLQVHITEFDVRVPVDAERMATPESLAQQAEIYRDITSACVKYPGCSAIQLWGFTDRYSWIPGTYRGFGAALLFTPDYAAKPAYQAIQSALRQAGSK